MTPGRPNIGPTLRATCPPWIHQQIGVLLTARSERLKEPVPLSDMIRDVLRAGLFAMAQAGVNAPGFDPGQAHCDAAKRGEAV